MKPIISSRSQSPIIPVGQATGCLPRKSRLGEWFPRAEDRIPLVPRDQWAEAAAQMDLPAKVPEILNQGRVSSCAAEATTGALMLARAWSGLPHVPLNPWSIYRITSGGRDNGSSIDENLQVAQEQGVCPANLHSRGLGWNAKPSAEAIAAAQNFRILEVFDIGSIDEMVSALLRGFPVVYGSAGHAVCKVKHLDESKGLDLNSWGAEWGDKGFGIWATYRAVNWGYGAFAVRVAG